LGIQINPFGKIFFLFIRLGKEKTGLNIYFINLKQNKNKIKIYNL